MNETKLRNRLAEAAGKSLKVLTLDWVDAVLRSPLRIPALPKLAEEHAQQLDDVVRNPRGHVRDEGKAKQRYQVYSRWYSDVKTEIERDGILMLRDLERLAPEEHERFENSVERVVSLLAALRDLKLPWWPCHRVDRAAHRELTLLDWVEQELGRLETSQLRRGGARALTEAKR